MVSYLPLFAFWREGFTCKFESILSALPLGLAASSLDILYLCVASPYVTSSTLGLIYRWFLT